MLRQIYRVGLIVCGLLFAQLSYSQIERIGQIQHTSRERAAEGVAVMIEAQVTHFHPRRAGVFLHDGERGIYVHLQQSAESYDDLRVGSILLVKGKTALGGFVPDVIAEEIEVIDWQPLEKPRQFHFFEVFLPNFELDCAWLSVWGRIVDVKVLEGFDYLMLELEVHGLRLSVQVPYSVEALDEVERIMFQRVYVPAVVGTIYNKHRQMTGRTFLVNSISDFIIITDEEQSAGVDARAIEDLMRAGDKHLNQIDTQGLVTYADESSVYLRGEEACLKAAILGQPDLSPGDYVNLRGVIWAQPISPAFRAREVTVLGQRDVPAPKIIDFSGELNPDWCYELVQVEATLVDIGETFGLSRFSAQPDDILVDVGRVSLLCRSGDRLFEARLPSKAALDSDLKPGAIIQLTGICNLVPNVDPRWSHFTEGAWLELRLNDGVGVLRSAPWWTTKRLFTAIIIVLGFSGLFMVWIILLRKTVVSQTHVIGKQIEEASVQNERHRIARELHDTLEQSLAGATFQLENCLKQIDNDLEKGKKSLKLAEGMLRNCREESRSSIVELRGSLLEKMDLPSAVEQALEPIADELGVKLQVTVQGQVRRLTLRAGRHFFRVAKEAVINAIQHASPSEVRVDFCYEPNSMSLAVTDDGAGFNVDTLSNFERFGLQGMRERANRLNGSLTIESVIGEGTTIRLDLPSTKEWEREET